MFWKANHSATTFDGFSAFRKKLSTCYLIKQVQLVPWTHSAGFYQIWLTLWQEDFRGRTKAKTLTAVAQRNKWRVRVHVPVQSAPVMCWWHELWWFLNNSEANPSQQEVHFLCAECFAYKNEREVPLRQPSRIWLRGQFAHCWPFSEKPTLSNPCKQPIQ